jgi:RHS repeat-associated protein
MDIHDPAAVGEYHSTAFNFIHGSVDPRTGMYSARVELATGQGNRLRGPSFEFCLSYSPLRPVDDGFGEGWRLRLTELDRASKLLTLGTGEAFAADALQPGVTTRFADRKLETFILTPGPGLQTAVVEHATGCTEHLALPGDLGGTLKPVRVLKQNGEGLSLAWGRRPNGAYGLSQVVDDEGVCLLRIEYVSMDETVLELSGGPGDPAVVFRFLRENNLLREVELTTVAASNVMRAQAVEPVAWGFEYIKALDPPVMMLLGRTLYPTGIDEELHYDEHALPLPPGAPRQFMPAVDRRTQRRRFPVADVIEASRYSYDTDRGNNAYGYPVVSRWATASDELLHLAGQGRFRYGSIETRLDVDLRTPLYEVRRRYNQFHLAVEETTTRGNVVSEVVTRYGDVEDLPFSRQPASFQLPHRVTSTLFDRRLPDIRRITLETTAYDDAGNIVEHHASATGITEAFVHFPVTGARDADGSVLCPPDPLGLVRRLHTKTTTPGPGGGPVLTSTYRYVAIATSARDGLGGRTHYVQAERETTTAITNGRTRELARSERTYFTAPGAWQGSLMAETHVRDGIPSRLVYRHEADAGTVTTITEQYAKDEHVGSRTEIRQRVTGMVVAGTDVYGNRTEYRNDPMGRPASMVVHPQMPDYRAETSWRYQMSAQERWIERVGITGLVHRTSLDEHGNVVRIEEPSADGTLDVVGESIYDGEGRLVEDHAFDRVDPGREIRLTTRYHYGDWGDPDCVVEPDGSQSRRETTLAVDGTNQGRVVTRRVEWRQSGDLRTDWVATETDQAGLMVRRETGTWDGIVRRPAATVETWQYDGLGRCTAMTDTLKRVTGQTFDEDGRVTTTTLPDGSAVSLVYAAGSEAGHVADVLLTSPAGEAVSLGHREYDVLGRVTTETSGSLTTRFTYDGPGALPAVKNAPSGGTLSMRYDVRLASALVETTLTEPGRASVVTASADYDTRRREPRAFRSDQGRIELTPDYLGRFTVQRLVLEGDRERSVRSTPSPAGRDLEKRLADGSLQRFVYDDIGRLVLLSDSDVETVFEYDAFSRVIMRTSRSVDGPVISDARRYDGRGRPRTQTWSGESEGLRWQRSVEMEWRADDKLSSRCWYGGQDMLLREESFDYDDKGRLTAHDIAFASPGEYPVDAVGRPYARQVYTLDALDNLLSCETLLADGRVDVASFSYDPVDPDRMVGYRHSLPDSPGAGSEVRLAYDAGGNLIDDGQGLQLGWDGAGRLQWISLPDGTQTRYAHGPDGRICATTLRGRTAFRYYDDGVPACEVSVDGGRRYVRTVGGPVAESVLTAAVRQTWLLGPDPQGSTCVSVRDGVHGHAYGAFGSAAHGDGDPRMAFAGQAREEGTSLYVLGNRIYSPALRRFVNADPASPFGAGGLNRYAYCGGDPINRVDPSGNAWWDWLLAGVGLVAAVAGAIASGGALAGALGAATVSSWSMLTATLSAVVDVLAVAVEIDASVALAQERDPVLGVFGATLGGVGAAMGIGAAVKGLRTARAASAGTRGSGLGTMALGDDWLPAGGAASPRLPPSGLPRRMIASPAEVPADRYVVQLDPHGRNSRVWLKPAWARTTNEALPGAVHYGADTPLKMWHVLDGLPEIAREHPVPTQMYLYAGAHGGALGNNWTRTQRALREPVVFRDAAGNHAMFAAAAAPHSVRIEDIGRMPRALAERYFARPGIHVHAYCYGAVDDVLLRMFNAEAIDIASMRLMPP